MHRFKLSGRILLVGLMLMILAYYGNKYLGAAPVKRDIAALDRAADLRGQGKFRVARDSVRKLILADPKWIDTHIAMAALSLDLFNPETAKAEIDKARALGAKPDQYLALKGHALWLQGDLDGAEAALTNNAIPTSAKLYATRLLGRVYTDRGNFNAARNVFDRALAIDNKNSLLWSDIGRFRLANADQLGAIQAADTALNYDNKNIRAYELRGQMARTKDGLIAALPWFEKGLRINPYDVPLLEEYAATLGDLGRNKMMLSKVRMIISLDSKNSRALYMQAVIAARAGDYELTKRILLAAGDDMDDLPAAQMLSGIAEYETGNSNQAITILQQLSDTQPQNQKVKMLLALALYRSGDSYGAIDVLSKSAARADSDSYSQRTAAYAFAATGKPQDAVKLIDMSSVAAVRATLALIEPLSILTTSDEAARDPNNARKVIANIRNLISAGQLDQASSDAARLQSSNPGVSDAHILVGDVASLRGQFGAAVAAYSRARAISFSQNVMLKLVDLYRRQNNEAAARDTIAQYYRQNPDNLYAQKLTAYVYLDQGKWTQALPLLEYLLGSTGYNDSILNANLARAYAGLKRSADAINFAKLAYQIDPMNPMTTHVYGQVLLRNNGPKKATYELLQKAAILMPENTEVLRERDQAKQNLLNFKGH